MKKILVCGATGFIGRNIAASLAARKEYEVYGTYLNSDPFSDSRINLKQVDLTDKNAVSEIMSGMDVVIQAAAVTTGSKDTITRPYIHVTDNAVMNSLILRAAYEQKVSHMVFFSCAAMYQSSDVPVKETDFDANEEMYPSYFGIGWTKFYTEKMCEFYSGLGGIRFTVLRHSNIYGPLDKFDLQKSHVFGATITKVMTAKDGDKIIVWGEGNEERDLLYISDLVDFVELAIEKQGPPFELLNVGLGEAISIDALVKKIILASGKNLKMEYDPAGPTIKTGYSVDTTKALNALGWAPKVSLDEGIGKTIEWYKENVME